MRFRIAINFLLLLCFYHTNSSAETTTKTLSVAEYQLEANQELLKEFEIEHTQEGVLEHLQKYYPNSETRIKTEKLVESLGSLSYEERYYATMELIQSPFLPMQQLRKATNSEDPEVSFRAQKVIETATNNRNPILRAVYQIITAKKYPHCAIPVLKTVSFCDDSSIRDAAHEAIRASITKDDIKEFRKALTSEDNTIKVAAIQGLGTILDPNITKELIPFLSKKHDPKVQLTTATIFANRGDRRCLATLTYLLSDKELDIRSESIRVLRELCRQDFAYSPYDDDNSRVAPTSKWTDWVSKQGLTAKLHFPLDLNRAGRSYLNGNMLLAYGYKNKVEELDPKGNVIWSYPARGAWSAEKLANGNVLIAAYYLNKVIEVNRKKEVVWEFAATRALNARVAPNGNYIICGNNMVQEVNRKGKVVWSHSPGGQCYDAHRLRNGNTIVAWQRSVTEFDRKGRKVWEYQCTNPYGIQPLPNGNILVSQLSSKVQEVTRKKKIVWEHKEQNAVDAFRLPNGNTLITGSSRFLEVTPKGKVLWTRTGCSYGTARK